MIGKVPQELLDGYVLGRTGAPDDRVIQPPAYGEDTGAISLTDGELVVSTDPISLASSRLGTLGVHIACNDIAASGASPEWLTVALFLNSEDSEALDEITQQLHETAAALDVTIVTGHSEYASALERPMLVLTAFGLTDRYIPTGGATDGDAVVMTKSAGIEGTAILASDFETELRASVDAGVIERGRSYFDQLSVIEEATLLGDFATGMHDPTEGGLLNGLVELAHAGDVHVTVDRDAVPVAEDTRTLCAAMDVDPLRIFSSGSLLATIPESHLEEATAALSDAAIPHATIGSIDANTEPGVTIGTQTIDRPIRDEMYALWE